MSKVSYKVYFNDRLKQVSLHGQITYPLYIQVTYKRKSIFFKSYYFELFSKSRYFLPIGGLGLNTVREEAGVKNSVVRIERQGPSIEEIIAKEKEVIDFIIDRHPNDFSLDLFKHEYAFYSSDLCDITEEGFIDYMYTFLQDKGLPAFALMVREGGRYCIAYEVIRDLKIALSKPFYDELIENSLYYSPPYLPLYGFMRETKRWPMLCVTVMEWEEVSTQTAFTEYVKKHYPEIDAAKVMEQVENWLDSLKS